MLKCVAVVDGKSVDFENQPLLLGYQPLILGICENAELIGQITSKGNVQMEYRNSENNELVASLELNVMKQIELGSQTLLLTTPVNFAHWLETRMDRFLFRLNNKLQKKPADNLELDSAGYDMLKIGYSVPREIRAVTVRMNDDTGNTFPIDLFGHLGNFHFILSLRKDKESCSQVEETKQITTWILGEPHAEHIYKLGSNHSRKPGKIILPEHPVGREIFDLVRIIGDVGIHRLFLFQNRLSATGKPEDRLVHVHRSYANWHKRQGFPLKEINR